MWPSELDALVMTRIPVRDNYEDRYFTDTYQAMPKQGYARIFESILASPSIEVRLNTDYFAVRTQLRAHHKLITPI